MRETRRSRRRIAVVVAVAAATLSARPAALAQDAALDASADVAADVPADRGVVPDPRTALVRALIDDALPTTATPGGLFDIDLDDELALRVEALRVRAMLSALDATLDAGVEPDAGRRRRDAAVDVDLDGSLRGEMDGLDPARLLPRVELDRARLAFYSLPRARRAALIADHAARVEAARPRETDNERLAREAEAERLRALEAARRARSEAERLVGEEVARLIGVQQSVLAAQARFQRQREALAASRDAILGWRRRARAARAGSGDDPDAMYDAVRQALRGARDDLERALDDLDSTTSVLPALGPDPLSVIAVDVPTAAARERRRSVAALISAAKREETALRASRASTRFEACEALNLERLALIPSLSSAKRDAVTGFSAAGLDQARAEARQLSLILRYHRRIGAKWLDALVRQRRVEGASTWELVRVGLSLLLALIAFVWLSRHSASVLAFTDERLSEADRVERRVTPSPLLIALRALRGVHRPLGRLALFQAVVWILPTGLRGLLEAQLVMTIVGWLLAGSLVVNAINAAAARRDDGEHGDDALRLRSLKLVGRVVVGFALVLVLSARLVGKGTVYDWTLILCWFAAAPLVLILTAWWRESIFARVERVKRKRSPTQAWVLSKREGWQSFFAAMVGAAHLIVTGVARVARAWLGDFDLVRRGHAYLFKRELERLGDGGPREVREPLRPEALEALSPDRPSATWIASPATAHRDALQARASRREGGVVALVGRQGMGKSLMFRHLAEAVPDALLLSCDTATGAARISEALARATAAATPPRAPALVILDDAHAMVKPVFGGLKAFDETLALARGRSDETLWVFAVDAIVWPFLRRARDTRPMFDEVTELAPWTDAQIGELLSARSAEAGLSPIFDDLLERLPASADELDRQEALATRRNGYFRMIWDYARGNPAIALESWRASLVEDGDGGVRVRALQTPNVDSLETLPDEALFVLRAVLQMSPASPRDVADATRVPLEQVENVFRFGRAAGYLAQRDARVFVPWRWRRPVILLLERRHLLVNP